MFSAANETLFSLDVEGQPNTGLQVLAFDGVESLNAEYVIEVTLINKHVRFDITKLLSQAAYLSFSSDKKQGIHGIIQAVKRNTIGKDYATFKVLIMPAFTHLRKRVNNRAFVGKTVPEIITTLFKEHGLLESQHFEFKFKDKSVYTPREFCCQYNESDAH